MMIKAKLIQSVNFNKVSVFEHLNISLLCSPPQWSSAKCSFRKDEKDLTLILMQITPSSKKQLVYWLFGDTTEWECMLSSNQTIEYHSKLKELSEEGTFIVRNPLENEVLGKFSNSLRKNY